MMEQRRNKLQNITVLTAHDAVQSRNDAAYPFVQEANFIYLTGISHPGWRLIVDPFDKKSYLVAPHVSKTSELFDGSLSRDEARKISGISDILIKKEADILLKELAQKHGHVATLGKHPHSKYYDFTTNPAQARLTRQLKTLFKEVRDVRSELSKQRAIKDESEIAAIREAISVTITAFRAVRLSLASAQHEYEIEAVLNDGFRRTGADGHAYTPIVAAGKNACTLHYIDNNDSLETHGLLLIDAGAGYHHYAADITRTYATGIPSARHKEIHTAVEAAHYDIISYIQPGVTLKEYQKKSDDRMKEALRTVGLLKSEKDYRVYFPHAISHGLGIDVHDSLGGHESFQPGMVLTVEPGIYIPEEGIGVRIEDDILVTSDGNENLSASLPTAL